MSYARFGWDGSKVYVFANTDDMIECCGCALQPRPDQAQRVEFATVDEMVEHLRQHQAAGQHVPPSCFDGLWTDRKNGELR